MSKEDIIKQLKTKKPKFVAKAFLRFRQEGVSEEEAVDILEQVYEDALLTFPRDKKKFEDKYEKELETYTRHNYKLNEVKKMTIEQLMAKVQFNEGYLPKYELCELASRKEELTPYLLQMLRLVDSDPDKFTMDFSNFEHIYAYYFMALFREKKAFPYVISMLHKDEHIIEELFGDILTERMPAIIAGVFNGDVDAIKEVIENKTLYTFARCEAVSAMTILVLNGELQRDEVMDYFRNLLREAKNEDETFLGTVVSECCSLHPKDAMEEIELAFKKKYIEEFYIGLDDVKRHLRMSLEEVIEASKNEWYKTMISDIIKEFEDFHCFNDIDAALGELNYHYDLNEDRGNFGFDERMPIVKEVNIGRNDPCPCGSGKKYKKCCGK